MAYCYLYLKCPEEGDILEPVTLPDDAAEARVVFQNLLDTLGLGLVVALGAPAQQSFAIASGLTGQPFNVVSVWARDIPAVQPVIEGLIHGDKVNFGTNGHRLIAINKLDQVSRCLSGQAAVDPMKVLSVVFCANEDEGPCDF